MNRNITAFVLMWILMILPIAVTAQTRIKMPKNKYKVQDDVKIGQQAAGEVEEQLPILKDSESTRYVQSVGQRLVNSIPSQFRHSEFRYDFEIVNASDINAFALPGGPMFVNRGMIEAAKNEGEMAGVMAHEISHVALRHGTAQATKQSNPLNQILGIGAILGGAILAGEAGAQLGALGVQAWMTRYSREYETQADILGAQIMADAGYDPRDLANMFKTIEAQGGSRVPEFLSSHPNPENRYENINREADSLRVSPNPIKNTRDFERIQSKLRRMPKAPTMAEIEQNAKNNPRNPTASGKYESSVPYPSSRMRSYSGGNFLRMSIPNNWEDFTTESSATFAPKGAYGDQGITHGAMIGLVKTRSTGLLDATEEYVNGVLQGNSYLRQQNNYSRASIDGRQAYTTTLSGRSPVTGKTEVATVYTTQLRNGALFYVVTVTPENEASRYSYAFRNLIRSIDLKD
ncbi:MAG: M48 family metallopeptidase [Pyrinomonadaceae bacterium]